MHHVKETDKVGLCAVNTTNVEKKQAGTCLTASSLTPSKGGGRDKDITIHGDVPISITTVRPNRKTQRNSDDQPTNRTEGGHFGSISQTYRPDDNPDVDENPRGATTTPSGTNNSLRPTPTTHVKEAILAANNDDPTKSRGEGGRFGSISHQDTVDQTQQRTPTEAREDNTNIKNMTTQEDDPMAQDDVRSRTSSEGNALPRRQREGGGNGKYRTGHGDVPISSTTLTATNSESARPSTQCK